jgi:hypothetical protein
MQNKCRWNKWVSNGLFSNHWIKAAGVPVLHYYSMGKSKISVKLRVNFLAIDFFLFKSFQPLVNWSFVINLYFYSKT